MGTKFLALIVLLVSASAAYAQGVRQDSVASTRGGFPAAGATIAVCSEPATVSTTPCSTLATLYTDNTTSTACSGALLPPNVPGSACSNPMLSDGLGNYHFYAKPGRYAVQIYGSGLTTFNQRDLVLSCDPTNCAIINLNNTLYVSQFAVADLGAKMNAAVTNCTVTLALAACKYIIDVGGTISTAPNFPVGSIVECSATNAITLATTWAIMHRNTTFNLNGCQFNYNQDSSSAAILVGKNSSGTVNTQNAAIGGCAGNCVTFATGTNFANVDAGDLISINGVNYNVSSVQSSTVLTLAAAPGTQAGVAYAATLLPPSVGTYLGAVTIRDLNLAYTGAGTTISIGVQIARATEVNLVNPHIRDFTGLQSVGLQLNGSLDARIDGLWETNNKCQVLVDQSVAGGVTITSNFNNFYLPTILAGGACASNAAVNIQNGDSGNTFWKPDMEVNLTRYSILSQAGSFNNNVLYGDFERNGGGDANSYDIAFSSGINNLAEGNHFTSLVLNTPQGAMLCTGAGVQCSFRNNMMNPANNFYTTAWNFIASATGLIANNTFGTSAHGDPANVQDTSGGMKIASLNNIKIMDGVKYPLTGVGLAQALSDAGANGTVLIPPNTTVAVDTTTPIAITQNYQTILCSGQGSVISYSGAGNLFNVSGSYLTMKDCNFTSTAIVSRASVSVFNILSGGSGGKLQGLMFTGAATINNGRVFNADLTTSGTGNWLLEHFRILPGGATTWTNAIFLRTSTGTVSGFTVNNLISFIGVTYSDAAIVADTGVDTLKMAQLEVGGAGIGINTRNSLAGQAPRWIYCYNCEIETSGANAGIQLDSVRLFEFIGGQVATAQNAFNITGSGTGGVNQVSVIGANLQNISQHCVLLAAAPTNVSFTSNTLEDCGVATNNTYDYFNVAAGSQDFHIDGNHFRQLNANKARYGVNLLAGASNFYTVTGNDFASAAIGTSYLNDLGTGATKFVHSNGVAASNSFFGGYVQPGSTAFAGLGTPANGQITYCPDCTIANPCAGAGTGALAKRLNGVWVCN